MGSNVFHAALGLNASSAVRVELGLVETKEAGKAKGFRPAVTYSAGNLTLRGGFESVKVNGTAGTQNGFGLSAGFAVNKDTSVNVNFAKKEDDKSFGVNAIMGAAGLGLIQSNGAGAKKSTTVYAAYTLPLMGVKGASVTPALSYAKGPPVPMTSWPCACASTTPSDQAFPVGFFCVDSQGTLTQRLNGAVSRRIDRLFFLGGPTPQGHNGPMPRSRWRCLPLT